MKIRIDHSRRDREQVEQRVHRAELGFYHQFTAEHPAEAVLVCRILGMKAAR